MSSQETLKKRIISTGFWHILQSFSEAILRLGSNLVMTRLLLPEAFGLLALATTFLTAVTLFADIGIKQSIAREIDGANTRFLRTAWVTKILRGCFIAGVLLILAILIWVLGPTVFPAETGYAQPEMPGLVALVALAPILQGAESTNRELAERKLGIKRLTLITLLAKFLSILSMITFAWLNPTVWSLMFGMLSFHVYFAIFTHTSLPGCSMRFEWDREISNRLWGFGKWIMGSSALTFLGRFSDNLILAGLMNATAFGFFGIAKIWISAGSMILNKLNWSTGYFALAEVARERPEDLKDVFGKFQRFIDLFCLVGFLGCLFLGPVLVDVLYTETYQEVAVYLQLMSGIFLLERMDCHSQLLLSRGDSRAMFLVSGLRAIGVCTLVPLLYSIWGVEGAILGTVLAPAVTAPYVFYKTKLLLGSGRFRVDIAILVLSLCVIAIVFSVVT